ncbi:MAG: serine/threonine protein kinase, partial [bacterium]|nr:serine/threonine protein kinase [bacterium]
MAPERIGPYRVERKLGSGGMGEVYQAYDEQLERSVAIKLIRAEILEHTDARERFQREARTVADLDHPSIVRIHHILPWEDHHCIVMEHVDGESLWSLLRAGSVDFAQALALGREIALALAYAHDRGVVHRDLKPQNVMVSAAGRAKILDFGLAKRLSQSEPSLSVEGKILGTLHTMSPEQAQGQEVDHRADLFSLGALMYETFSGGAPFRGENAQET